MRRTRPSGKAVLVVGALALTLVVGATSGAVAGAMITSKDIKNNTIRGVDIRTDAVQNSDISAGAVSWDKSLDQATKDQIAALIEEGADGHAGPAGPPGAPGARGVDGSGTLAGWRLYDAPSGDSAPLTIANPIDPDGDPVELPLEGLEPVAGGSLSLAEGSYLVTLRSLSPTLGVWVPQLSTATDLAGPTPSMGICLSLFLPCETTFPVVVGPGGADLDLYLGDIGAFCGCAADPEASLSAVSLGTGSALTVPAVPELDAVVNGLVAQVVALLEGLDLSGLGLKQSMRQLHRQYLAEGRARRVSSATRSSRRWPASPSPGTTAGTRGSPQAP